MQQKFKSKEAEIQAIQYLISNAEEVTKFLGYQYKLYTNEEKNHIIEGQGLIRKLKYGEWFCRRIKTPHIQEQIDWFFMTDKDFKEKWESI